MLFVFEVFNKMKNARTHIKVIVNKHVNLILLNSAKFYAFSSSMIYYICNSTDLNSIKFFYAFFVLCKLL